MNTDVTVVTSCNVIPDWLVSSQCSIFVANGSGKKRPVVSHFMTLEASKDGNTLDGRGEGGGGGGGGSSVSPLSRTIVLAVCLNFFDSLDTELDFHLVFIKLYLEIGVT